MSNSAPARVMMRRVPLMAGAMLSMACGTWLGLTRLGWTLPLPWPDHVIAHGPLMVCGFLGTLISLERAVALGSPWGYAAPACVAAGALALVLPVGPVGPLLIVLGSALLAVMFLALMRHQPTLFMLTMGLGALAWVIGNGFWLGGAPIFRVAGWWIAFLVLTIAGERLELNRVLRPAVRVRAAFTTAIGILIAGVVIAARWPESGTRVMGAGLVALSAWLMRYDVARRTVRERGLTRYMAVGLLAGYVWLGVGGLLQIFTDAASPGLMYDAALHAILLGFVMSMVFAHAPVIFPAVLLRPLVFRPRFYVHLGLLHVSVLLRVAGDLEATLGRWRGWGGVLNAVALAAFVVNVLVSMAILAPAQRRTAAPRRMIAS